MHQILREEMVSAFMIFILDSFHSSVYNKTLDYVRNFTKFNTTDSASAVREYVSCMSR